MLNLEGEEHSTVDGEQEPLISQKDFNRVQAMLSAHKQELDEIPTTCKNQRLTTIGKKKPADAWTKLLECECGHRLRSLTKRRLNIENPQVNISVPISGKI